MLASKNPRSTPPLKRRLPPTPPARMGAFALKLDRAFRQIAGGQVTIRHVEIPEPGVHSAAAIRKLRRALGVSQPVFARLMGISTVLVQSWEQGQRIPSQMARRLLDEIAREPHRWASTMKPVA
ncbi:MAG TPA: helix-turn-helix domain-containing protein [Tepidisphaeraceae bacterium]